MAEINVKTSVLGSRLQGTAPLRYSGNPLGWQVPNATRESLAMTSQSPRMRHPRLNMSPWSQSYRVNRTQKQTTKGKKTAP